MAHPVDAIRRQYRRNAEQLARMIMTGKYRGHVLRQMEDAQARAAHCAQLTDAQLADHLADCRRQVSARLAEMMEITE